MCNIAIVAEQVTRQTIEISKGIYDFAKSTPDWSILGFNATSFETIEQFPKWGIQGVVAFSDGLTDNHSRALQGLGVQVVSIGPHLSPFPSVRVNLASVATVCANLFPEQNFSRVGFVARGDSLGIVEALHSRFGERLIHRRFSIEETDLLLPTPPHIDIFAKWIRSHHLSALIANCDLVAIYLLRIATASGIEIPDCLSILSIRDSLACELPSNDVTAIVEPNQELGFQAACLLHRQLQGQPAPTGSVFVDMATIVERSTTQSGCSDRNIARALQFIEENAKRGITVSDLMAFQRTSRVTFERKFREQVGCSPGDKIRRVRLDNAKELLSSTSDSISMIGRKCGFSSSARFSAFFNAAMGMSPRQFRQSVEKQQHPD